MLVAQADDDMAGGPGRAGSGAAEARPDDTSPGVAILEGVAAELDDVERALQRLDDGSYGRCERCRAPIDDDRLAAHPATRLCGAHALAPPP